MADCFLSYAQEDLEIAHKIKSEIEKHSLNVFLAEGSLTPGDEWSETIQQELVASSWVLVLVTKNFLEGSAAMLETGFAHFDDRTVIPFLWGVEPHDLPSFLNEHQAIDLTDLNATEVQEEFQKLGSQLKSQKQVREGLTIIGAAFIAYLVLSN